MLVCMLFDVIFSQLVLALGFEKSCLRLWAPAPAAAIDLGEAVPGLRSRKLKVDDMIE